MKIQLAIDRLSIKKAKEIAKEAAPYVDIIEVGTALIKEYGMLSVRELKKEVPDKIILADIKTIDEGAYEFISAFKNGADIATVMGAASMETLKACYEVTKNLGKSMMIDLLEVEDNKIYKLKEFSDAIFCIHAPFDGGEQTLISRLTDFKTNFHDINNIAVAGGVNMNTIVEIKKAKVDIVIIGGAITKSSNIEKSAKGFREML